jgi:hypothetical protein
MKKLNLCNTTVSFGSLDFDDVFSYNDVTYQKTSHKSASGHFEDKGDGWAELWHGDGSDEARAVKFVNLTQVRVLVLS